MPIDPSFVPYLLNSQGVPYPDPSSLPPGAAALLTNGAPQARQSPQLDLSPLLSAAVGHTPYFQSGGPVSMDRSDVAPAGQMRQEIPMNTALAQTATPAHTALESQIGDVDNQSAALLNAIKSLKEPELSFPNALDQANTAIAGAGGDVTKTLGGDWSGRTGIPGMRTPVAPQSPAANMPSGQVLDGSFVPDSGIGEKKGPGELSAPQSKGAMDSRMAQILLESKNPTRQAADAAAAQKQKDSQGIINNRAMLAKDLRNLQGTGLSPEEAMSAEQNQKIIESLRGGGGGSNDLKDVVFPQLAAGRRADETLSNEKHSTDAIIESNKLGRVDQRQKARADLTAKIFNGGAGNYHTWAEAQDEALKQQPFSQEENELQQRGAPIGQPPPPSATDKKPAPANANTGGPIPLPQVRETAQQLMRGVDPADSDAVLDAIGARPEILRNPHYLGQIARELGLTPQKVAEIGRTNILRTGSPGYPVHILNKYRGRAELAKMIGFALTSPEKITVKDDNAATP